MADGLVVVALLALLVHQELLSAHGGARWAAQLYAVRAAVVPLAVVFAIVVTARFAELLS